MGSHFKTRNLVVIFPKKIRYELRKVALPSIKTVSESHYRLRPSDPLGISQFTKQCSLMHYACCKGKSLVACGRSVKANDQAPETIPGVKIVLARWNYTMGTFKW